MTRELGKIQKAVLGMLRERDAWWEGCGWYWDNWSNTKRVMDTLVKRGVAKIEPMKLVQGRRRDVYTAVETPPE
jgi:hypothetical protein